MADSRPRVRRFVARTSIAISCAALSGWVGESSARAEASLADKAAAQTLFDEGRKLIAAGKYADACPKLAESERLDPGVGTQFHLADCYERIGQTASAWAGFLEAAAGAKSMGQADREKAAKDRAAALAPRLSKLTIASVESSSAAGLEIKRDGAPVGRALWGTAIPIDPGSHVIEATAPGKKAWKTTARVEGDMASVVVTIPVLEDAAPRAEAQANPQANAAVDTGAAGASRRTLGLIVGGVGIVGLGVGTAFAVDANSKYKDSLVLCPADKNICQQSGVTLRDDARTAGNVATIAVGAGAAALVAGVLLFFTAPSSTSEKPRAVFVPTAGPRSAGLAVVGTY